MAIIALLDLKLRADKLAEAPDALGRVLAETRSFEGCQSVEVLVDEADETHWVAYERWESADANAKYREWRAGPGQSTELGSLLAGVPSLTMFTVSDV